MYQAEIHIEIETVIRYLHCLIFPNWLPRVIDTLNCKCKLKMHINYIQMKYSGINRFFLWRLCSVLRGKIELKEQRNKDKIRAGKENSISIFRFERKLSKYCKHIFHTYCI